MVTLLTLPLTRLLFWDVVLEAGLKCCLRSLTYVTLFFVSNSLQDPIYIYINYRFGDTGRSKFVFMTYVPDNLSGMKKSRVLGHRPAVEKLLKYMQLSWHVLDYSEFSEYAPFLQLGFTSSGRLSRRNSWPLVVLTIPSKSPTREISLPTKSPRENFTPKLKRRQPLVLLFTKLVL